MQPSAEKATNIIFYGIGGQGVLKASEACCVAALLEKYHVKKTEVHGMSQRGGSVESCLRFGPEVVSPLIPKGQADFIVCLHPEEYKGPQGLLREGGADLIAYTRKAYELLADQKLFVNSFMLGVLSGYLTIAEENWLKALKKVFGEKRQKENLTFFKEGRTWAKRL
jgi:indolepyruvate ferredoxin oxidoreductase beta subunit